MTYFRFPTVWIVNSSFHWREGAMGGGCCVELVDGIKFHRKLVKSLVRQHKVIKVHQSSFSVFLVLVIGQLRKKRIHSEYNASRLQGLPKSQDKIFTKKILFSHKSFSLQFYMKWMKREGDRTDVPVKQKWRGSIGSRLGTWKTLCSLRWTAFDVCEQEVLCWAAGTFKEEKGNS